MAVPVDGRAGDDADRAGWRPVAALLHDPALHDEPELLDAVTAAAGIALENARLHVELRRGSKSCGDRGPRVIDAGRRSGNDWSETSTTVPSSDSSRCHSSSGCSRSRSIRTPTRARGSSRREQIADSLAELRDVAHGIHPAVVSAHGLAVALEQLAARAPVPVASVEVDERLPEPVEVAAYYVVSESLANIGKHAQASRHGRGQRDDGARSLSRSSTTGSAAPTPSAARVCAGLADRVEALGGRLRIWSPRGGGTRREGGDPVRVVIAEDSVLLREGLERLLATTGSTSWAAATTPTTCCSKLRSYRRTSRSSTSGCRRPTPTKGCGRRSRSAPTIRRSACSCSRSTSSSGWR